MKEDNKNLIDEMIEKMKELPPEGQSAMLFVIENFDLIKKMCEKSDMTDEEIQKWTEKAKAKDDYIMLALLTFAQVYKDKRSKFTTP